MVDEQDACFSLVFMTTTFASVICICAFFFSIYKLRFVWFTTEFSTFAIKLRYNVSWKNIRDNSISLFSAAVTMPMIIIIIKIIFTVIDIIKRYNLYACHEGIKKNWQRSWLNGQKRFEQYTQMDMEKWLTTGLNCVIYFSRFFCIKFRYALFYW